MAKEFDKPYTAIEDGNFFLKVDPTPTEIIHRQVADAIALDREGKVKAALILLGWTPPPDEQYPSSPRLSPDGKSYICDQCGKSWKIGHKKDPCPPCDAAFEMLEKRPLTPRD